MQSVSSDAKIVESVDPSLWHKPWCTEEIARNQLALVYQELGRWLAGVEVKPFSVFLSLLAQCECPEPIVVMEVGCGVGHYGQLLKMATTEGRYFYKGVDCSEAMVHYARLGFGLGTVTRDDGENLSRPDLSQDVVVLGSCLNHTPDWKKMAEEAKRVTRKYAMLHRMPMRYDKTVVVEKLGYGHPMAERHFCAEDVFAVFGKPIAYERWSRTDDGYQASYLFEC